MPGAYTWPLASPPVSGSGGSDGTTADVVSPINRVTRGILTPFQRDQISDFASGSGLALAKAKILQVLGTRGDSDRVQGELPWRSDFGSLLHLLQHSNNDTVTAQLAMVYGSEAIARWLPSIVITDASVVRDRTDEGENVLSILFTFAVQESAGAQNLNVDSVLVPVVVG
jgi:hypothetical protein